MPLSLSTSPRPGPHTTLTFSCLSSCFQASVRSVLLKPVFTEWHVLSWFTVASLFLTVGLYYCFNNLSDARIFIIMYGVTSMYFSAVMVRSQAFKNTNHDYNQWFFKLFRLNYFYIQKMMMIVLCRLSDLNPLSLVVASSGTSDVGAGTCYVHPVRHRCVSGTNHLYEEPGCESAR